MNLYNDYFLKRNNTLKNKNRTYFNTLINEPKTTLKMKNIHLINNSYINNSLENNEIKKYSFNNDFNNNINYDRNNNTQINQDIIGYNNYIINGNNFNEIDYPEVKSLNNNFLGLSNYIKNTKVYHLNKINQNQNGNKLINSMNNNKNFSLNLYDNNDIDYMNMKLNFKILEQKISNLSNILLPTDRHTNTNHNNTINTKYNSNNISNENSFINENTLKTHNTDIYFNNKLGKFLKKKDENKNTTSKIKKSKQKLIYNLPNKKDSKNESKYDKYDEILYNNNTNKLKYINKDSDNLSEIADNILNIMKKNKKKDKISDDSTDERPIKIFKAIKNKKKFIVDKKMKNKKNKSKNDKTEYSISNLPEIFYKSDNNKNKKEELIVEHVFTYNHSENYNKKKNNKDNNDNKDINDETRNNILDKNENNNNEDNNNNYENVEEESEEEGEKIINSLIAQATQSNKEDLDKQNIFDNNKLSPTIYNTENNSPIKNQSPKRNNNSEDIKTNEKIKSFIPNKNQKSKKVTFDENLIYIVFYQDNKVTKMHILEKNKKPLQLKPKDIDSYLKILNSSTDKNNIKPAIKNTKIIDINNIINKIEKKKELVSKLKNNKKINQIKNITQRNIDFIKIIQKRGNVHNISKEKFKKKLDSKKNKQYENSCNLKSENRKRNSSLDKAKNNNRNNDKK